jgi:formate hydrogenlyase subunit 3/multisubunit Na+/H+ antiporter MnhD subunit
LNKPRGLTAMARFLIVFGLVILVAGLLWPYLSQIGLGRLPGDIVIERNNVTFYFPLMTCLLVSLCSAWSFGSSTAEW